MWFLLNVIKLILLKSSLIVRLNWQKPAFDGFTRCKHILRCCCIMSCFYDWWWLSSFFLLAIYLFCGRSVLNPPRNGYKYLTGMFWIFVLAMGIPSQRVPEEEANWQRSVLHRGNQDKLGPRVRHGVPGERYFHPLIVDSWIFNTLFFRINPHFIKIL